MQKILLLVILIIFIGIGRASADFGDSLFCLIKKDEIVISLRQGAGYYTCQSTIVSLENLIVSTAKDLMKVQTYINRGRDTDYRKSVKLEKKSLLDKLLLYRTNVLANIQAFQSNILNTSIQYFLAQINPYKIRLQRTLARIDASTGFKTAVLDNYISLITSQLATIDAFADITNTDQLTKLLTTYIYLKQEIAGKSEY